MSANPHANGGVLLRDLVLPDFREYAVEVTEPGRADERGDPGARRLAARRDPRPTRDRFRLFGPDEIASNRLGAVFEVTDRAFVAATEPGDDHLSPDGRVMEVLSEHLCQGWLEGYLLTGRHGLFTSYEAFIHVVDSMVNQHAKWLKVTRGIPWRRPIASLNYLLSSHVWRQDHNGFSHQDPGLHRPRRQQEGRGRPGLPAAGREHPAVHDGPLPAQPALHQRGGRRQAVRADLADDGRGGAALPPRPGHLGLGQLDAGAEPDVVLACAGDVPTLETLAAVDLLRRDLPDLKVRVVNVVDLMRLQPESEHPHGLPDAEFDTIFTTDKPVIFAYHGYPWLIHRLTYRRTNHDNLHVRGYKEEGTTTTPVRHGDAQRPGPLPPGHRRHRPGAGAGRQRRPSPTVHGRRAAAVPATTPASTARTTRASPAGSGARRPDRCRCGRSMSGRRRPRAATAGLTTAAPPGGG